MMDAEVRGSTTGQSSTSSLNMGVHVVTNSDIYDGLQKLTRISPNEVMNMVRNLFNLNENSLPKCRTTNIYNKVMKVQQKVKDMNRNKVTKVELNFLDSEFKLPVVVSNSERALSACDTKEKQLKEELFEEQRENKALKRKLEKIEHENETLNN